MLPEFVDDPRSTPTTLHEPGRYRCRCIYVAPEGGALWQHLDGPGTVWTPVEEGVKVAVGAACYITVQRNGRPLLWLFPRRDEGHAVHPEDAGLVLHWPA